MPKYQTLTNFSNALKAESTCYRPEDLIDLQACLSQSHPQGILARGRGLSYSDCCLNHEGGMIDTSRFNHFLAFDEKTGVLHCQGHVSFAELLQWHPDYIPPVFPGTQFATLAGGIANDIHGKNNPTQGSLGHHILEIGLLRQEGFLRVSPKQHADLFHATLGGLGLTGIILDVKLKMLKAPKQVLVQSVKTHNWADLLRTMQETLPHCDYQAAWLDFLQPQRAIHFQAASSEEIAVPRNQAFTLPLPKLPLLHAYNLKPFNWLYYHLPRKKTVQALTHFNNPLDFIPNWNKLYGSKGLLQFQGLLPEAKTLELLQAIHAIIKRCKATPTLAVLKLFRKNGAGWLSFCAPGFTLAIDFINNAQAKEAILALNDLMSTTQGRVYLAKDLFLTPEQLHNMYPQLPAFKKLLEGSPSLLQSNLARRLELV